MNNRGDEIEVVSRPRYWMYAPGPQACLWEEFYRDGIMGIKPDEVGDLTKFKEKADIQKAMKRLRGDSSSHANDVLSLWQIYNEDEMRVGDVVFAKRGRRCIVGRGTVESAYRFDSTRSEYRHVRTVNWTHIGEWEHPGLADAKTLTDITRYTQRVEELKARVLGGRWSTYTRG